MKNNYFYIIIIFFLISCNNKQSSNNHDGYQIYVKNACNTCHSLDGSRMIGPTLDGIFGSKVVLSNGKTVIADENYLIRSIIDPSIELVKGYPNLMGSYKAVLSADEINALIEFIKEQ